MIMSMQNSNWYMNVKIDDFKNRLMCMLEPSSLKKKIIFTNCVGVVLDDHHIAN